MKTKWRYIIALLVFASSLIEGRFLACAPDLWTVYSDGTCAGPGICDTAGNPGSYLTPSPPASCLY
jgi:hypothetical protein